MTKRRYKQMLPVITAWIKNQQIQYYSRLKEQWIDRDPTDSSEFDMLLENMWRIKPDGDRLGL